MLKTSSDFNHALLLSFWYPAKTLKKYSLLNADFWPDINKFVSFDKKKENSLLISKFFENLYYEVVKPYSELLI